MINSKTINSTQIAKLAGVSRSTVSKVINNYPDIPEATKNKVRSVIEEFGYVPNASAQVLKGKPQSIIALYIYISDIDAQYNSRCGIDSPYVMSVISSFIAEAQKFGYRLIIELIQYDQPEDDIVDRITGHFDSKSISSAAFLGLTESCRFIDRLVDKDLSLVVIDRNIDESKQAVSIYTNDYQGMFLATEHLIHQGFKSIAFIGGDDEKHSAKMRVQGYLTAIFQYDLIPETITGEFSEHAGYVKTDSILAMSPRPDAIVCASDSTAYGVIKRLQEKDQQYLNSIGLIGFDDAYFNDYQQPPLSSIKVDFTNMARLTVQALLDKENYQKSPILVELVIRASSQKRS